MHTRNTYFVNLLWAVLAAHLAAAPLRAEGKTCAELRDSYRLRERSESAPPRYPCPSPSSVQSGAPVCDPDAVWASLRELYIVQLSSIVSDTVGREAAEFLRASSMTIVLADLELRSNAYGFYESRRKRIKLPRKIFEPLWPHLDGSKLPPEAEAVVEITAAAMVHELRHARQDAALGGLDIFVFETESLAHGDEALFLWSRYERDPERSASSEFNRRLVSTAGLPSPSPQWWKQPFEDESFAKFYDLTSVVKKEMGPLLNASTVNDWFSARSLAGGFARKDRLLHWLKLAPPVSGVGQTPEYYARGAEKVKRTIKKLAACRDREAAASDRANFDLVLLDLRDDLRFYTDPAIQQRQDEYFRRERQRQEHEFERLSRAAP